MNSPLVSVIIPTYNMRQWVGEAIDSVLAQTYANTEIIVIDDGSTDGTGDFLRERYGDKIWYVYQENRGRGAARNHGLRLAQGEYIQFFDADDIMEPDALSARAEILLTHPEYAAAYGHALAFWDDDPAHPFETKKPKDYRSGDILEAEVHTPFLWIPMVLLRRVWADRVGGMDESLRSNEDWHFWLKVAAAGGEYAYVEGPPVARCRAYRSPRAPATTHTLSGIQVLENLRPLVAARSQYASLKLDRAIAAWRYAYGCALVREGHRFQGITQMVRSLRHNQDSFGAKLLQLVLSLLMPPDRIESTFLRLRGLVKGSACRCFR